LPTFPTELEAAVPAEGRIWLAGLLEGIRLTPRGHDVARLLATNPRAGAFLPASQIAKETGVNVATVVRFAQALGFAGWKEFQLNFRHHYLGSFLPSDLARDRSAARDSPFDAALARDVLNLQAAQSTVDRAELQATVRCVLGAARTLVVSSGSYSAAGHVLAHHASVMGLDVRLETRGGAHLIAALQALEEGDCVIGISFWRLVKHVVVAVREAVRRDLTTVAITDSIFSPLARSATHTLMVPSESVSFFQSMTAPLGVVYGLLAELHAQAGERADAMVAAAEELYGAFDVLYPWGDER
jgi:DNA-binding MurR/RpiR family transcriptional regulator